MMGRQRLTGMAAGLSLVFLVGGCGGGSKDGDTSLEIAKAQESEGAAWAKAKAEGKDKRASTQTSNAGGRGYVNRPGS